MPFSLNGLLGSLRGALGGHGDGWVEPQNGITRAIAASLDYDELAGYIEEAEPEETPVETRTVLAGAVAVADAAAAEKPAESAEQVPPQKKKRRLRFRRAA